MHIVESHREMRGKKEREKENAYSRAGERQTVDSAKSTLSHSQTHGDRVERQREKGTEKKGEKWINFCTNRLECREKQIIMG